MKTAVVFENVGKFYRTGLRRHVGVQAIRGVNLHVPAGQSFGILGPNRAGKTTIVKLLLSLCKPSEGKILRLDKPVTDRSTLSRIGYMHENQLFPKYLTATELLRFYAAISLVPYDKIQERSNHLLNRVGLWDRRHEPISRFSKGMVQRLGLAQSLINSPDLLILDEPTEGLDLLGRQLLREIIAEEKQVGHTVIIVSHVLSEVETNCDRLAIVNRGRIVKVANVSDLIIHPTTGARRSLEEAITPFYQDESP